MEHIWAPWRIEYILSAKPAGCFLCEKPRENNDAANFILHRGELNFVLLNSYPYNPAHLLVAPYRHAGQIDDLTDAERDEHFALVSRCVSVLKETFNPTGFNLGANLGAVAGAGVADHFHSHIVPRWQGDTNFMTVLGDVRVVPQALADAYRKLAGRF